jgi:hypothetical protein
MRLYQCASLLLILVLSGCASVAAQDRDGVITVCKGVTIPDGYTIIEETTSGDCPKGAYLIKKSAPKTAQGQATQLTEAELKEAKELLLLVDVMELKLSKAWNLENDFGVSNEGDYNYTKGAMNAVESLVKQLDKLPKGNYKTYTLAAAVAYADVGRVRLYAGTDDGETQQLEIARKYKLEDTDSHLWAWEIWQIARMARNLTARELNMPVRHFDEDR